MNQIANYILRLSVLGLVFSMATACSNNSSDDEPKTSNANPIKVTIYKVTQPSDNFMLPIGGQVVAADRTYINAKTNGYVTSIEVELGSSVNEGQVLARISNEELSARKARTEAMVQEAESGFELAEIEFNRMKRLLEKATATQREYDMAKSQYERAQAGLEQAKKALDEVNTFVGYTIIKAPFSGKITEKLVDQGALIDPSRPLFVLEKESLAEVEFFVPTSLYGEVRTGLELMVQVEGFTEEVVGKVVEISSSAAQAGGQFRARLAFDDELSGLIPGSYAKVLLPQNTDGNRSIRVPEESLVKRGELIGVYVVSNSGRAMLRWIRTGKTFNGQTEVLSGLTTGEDIILNAPANVADGVAIQGV